MEGRWHRSSHAVSWTSTCMSRFNGKALAWKSLSTWWRQKDYLLTSMPMIDLHPSCLDFCASILAWLSTVLKPTILSSSTSISATVARRRKRKNIRITAQELPIRKDNQTSAPLIVTCMMTKRKKNPNIVKTRGDKAKGKILLSKQLPDKTKHRRKKM